MKTTSKTTSNRPQTRIKESKNKRTPEEISGLFVSLLSRYPDQDLIEKALKAVASTRRGNRIADSVKLSILESWERYTVDQVQEGIRSWLSRGFDPKDSKAKERYLWGIIRNQNGQELKSQGQETGPKPTGSLLDEYYRNPEGWKVVGGRE